MALHPLQINRSLTACSHYFEASTCRSLQRPYIILTLQPIIPQVSKCQKGVPCKMTNQHQTLKYRETPDRQTDTIALHQLQATG